MTSQALGRLGAGPVGAGARRDEVPALAPRDQLVNVLEYEAQARWSLSSGAFAPIAGGERASFDRITLRPRMLSPAVDLDLGLTLFGENLFAPILVGPVANQARFHAEGERATLTGASAANAVVVLSSRSSVPLPELLAKAATPVWYQVFASDAAASSQVAAAVKAGCRVICVTVGVAPGAGGAWTQVSADWATVGAIARRAGVPVVVKGVATPADVSSAIASGAQGLVVSNHGGLGGSRKGALILSLAATVDAVGGQVPVLVDGSFARGTDILKALGLGARAVMVARPVMWGLAAYGADGVKGVLEMLQTELARYMAMCGKPTLASLDRSIVRVHAVRPGP